MRVEKVCRPLKKAKERPRVLGEDAPMLDLSSGKALCDCVREVLRFSIVGKELCYVLRLAGEFYAYAKLAGGRLEVHLSRHYNSREEAFSLSIVPSCDDSAGTFSSDSSLSALDSPRSEMF